MHRRLRERAPERRLEATLLAVEPARSGGATFDRQRRGGEQDDDLAPFIRGVAAPLPRRGAPEQRKAGEDDGEEERARHVDSDADARHLSAAPALCGW